MSNTVLSASAKGATFLILLQIGSRALTFGVNQFILRYLSPEILGGAVQLELFSITVLYFARESLRVALQRQQDGVQAVINLAYLAVLLGAPLSFFLAFLYLRSELPNIVYFADAIKVYAVASVIELLSEPGFAAASQKMLYKVRASAEGFAALARTAVTCGSVILAHRAGTDVGVMPFANGQLAFAMGLLVSYLYLLQPTDTEKRFSLLPKKMQNSKETHYILSYFSRPLCNLTFSLLLQSTLKYLLTQGDSILLTTLASLSDQGAYALASNYGGLIARMVFQPIEESSRNLFARLCAPAPPPPPPPPPSSSASPSSKASSTSPPSEPRTSSDAAHSSLIQAHKTLTTIIHLYLLISLPLVILAPPLIPLLLPSLLGPRWSATAAPHVLATYMYYIPFLALNGIVEAFVAAVASSADLAAQSVAMGASFVGFGSVAWGLLGSGVGGGEEKVVEGGSGGGWGGTGLVVANCVNLGGRIIWGMGFVRDWFGGRGLAVGWLGVLPSWGSLGLSVAMVGVVKGTEGWGGEYGVLGEVGRLGVIGSVYGGLLLFLERRFLMECYQMLRPIPQEVKEDEKKKR